MSLHAEVVELTRARFSQYEDAPMAVEPLEKGGSDRKFYRVQVDGHAPLIYVQYGQQREENRHYVEIGAFLERAGVRVPKMFLHELEDGRIWMEDLGDRDLWSFRHEPWPVRRALYEATLREVFSLHSRAHVQLVGDEQAIQLQPPFDERLYRWEQDYFLNNCLGRHFGIVEEKRMAIRATLGNVAAELDSLPRVLVHRDFQSQNIVICQGTPCFIDFQGMRYGLPQYDLASLLLDPYVNLTAEEQDELLRYYVGLWIAHGEKLGPGFFRVYHLCAAQRLMQALGAYGFLGHERGKPEFLAHIPVALPRLRRVISSLSGFEELEQTLAGLLTADGEALR